MRPLRLQQPPAAVGAALLRGPHLLIKQRWPQPDVHELLMGHMGTHPASSPVSRPSMWLPWQGRRWATVHGGGGDG